MTIEDKKQAIIKLFVESPNWNSELFNYSNKIVTRGSFNKFSCWTSRNLIGGFKLVVYYDDSRSRKIFQADITKEEYEMIKFAAKITNVIKGERCVKKQQDDDKWCIDQLYEALVEKGVKRD